MRGKSLIPVFFLLFFWQTCPAQPVDTAYDRMIKAFTTDVRFLPSSVLNLKNDPHIPSPLKHFGSIIGAPGVMHRTTEIYGYYKKLSESSPLVRMEQSGTTEEGRPIHLVIIASEGTLRQIDQYKNQLSLLADPRKLKPAEADSIMASAKPVFYLNGGLHSTEMGSPEMLMELAYRLVTDNSTDIKKIRDNTIVIINPVSEPDGRDKQVDWYYRYSRSRASYDDGFRRSPPYWGKYVFHDNNRDGLQVSQAVTRAIFKNYYDWHPTVMLDLHESVPLIYMSTGTGPYNETIDPITIGEWQIMANHDITALAAQGLPGAFTWAFYDGWYPGYGIWVANNHNSIGRFYETFGNAGGNTYLRDLSEFRYAGDLVTSKEWYRPDPATPWVNWSSRNNINYMEAGVLASLQYTADNARVLLRNFYQKGVNNIQKGKTDKTKAFLIPAAQRDPFMAAYLVNQLRKQQIEVHRVDSGKNRNDYIVLLDQPYRNLAVSLLTRQDFSKEAKFPPYDDIAWTLGYLYGVEVKAEDSVRFAPSSLRLLTGDVRYEPVPKGSGDTYLLEYKGQQMLLPSLYWLKQANSSAQVLVMDAKTSLSGRKDSLSAGTVYLKGVTASQATEMAKKFGLDLQAARTVPAAAQHAVHLPRVAIYHTWYTTQDEGWSRYTFEQLGIPYTSIQKDDLKKGGLRSRFDAILIPRTGGTASDFINEIDSRFGPMPYTRTAEFPAHGYPDSTSDMTGGPGYEGLEQLKRFALEGGLIISLDNSSQHLVNTGIVSALQPFEAAGLFHPGSVVQVKARRADHPLLYGFPEVFPIFRGNGPLLQAPKYSRNLMVLQYGTRPLKDEEKYTGPILGMPAKQESKPAAPEARKEPPYVLSGMVRNEQTIIGHGAIFEVPLGKGKVVAFTFDPLHRYLNLHDAPLVWNALLAWDHAVK